MSRELRRVQPRSVESPLVAAALGLASFSAKLDRLLDANAPPVGAPPDEERRIDSDAVEAGLYFLLGLVAAKQRVAGLLADLAPPPKSPPADDAPRGAGIDRTLFR